MGTEMQEAPFLSIPELLSELHVARMTFATVNAELQAAQDAVLKKFAEDHAELMETVATQRQHLADIDAAIRLGVVEHYTYDPSKNKAPFPGVGIRVTTEYDYEAAAALDWAKEHRLCLALDTKAFKGVCKSDSTRPDFVTGTESVTATIATDLSAVVAEAENG